MQKRICSNWYSKLSSFKKSTLTRKIQRINVQTETIELASTSTASPSSLSSAISESEPRYTFFKYSHNLSGSSESPVVFIYTCPSGSKIKERMVYASTKQGFVNGVGGEFGIEVAKKVSISPFRLLHRLSYTSWSASLSYILHCASYHHLDL